MKKIILTVLLLVVYSITFSQSNYEKGMQKALNFWKEGKVTEASNTFERIANIENDNWLPNYYVAYVNIIAAFQEKNLETLTLKLDKAEKYLEKAQKITPNNVELLVLKALHHTVWVSFDGATYGRKYSGEISQIYQQAKEMDPTNPRVIYSDAEWKIGSAKYFGKDITPYCKDLAHALELFTTFKNETPFYPNWGKNRAEELYNNCK